MSNKMKKLKWFNKCDIRYIEMRHQNQNKNQISYENKLYQKQNEIEASINDEHFKVIYK